MRIMPNEIIRTNISRIMTNGMHHNISTKYNIACLAPTSARTMNDDANAFSFQDPHHARNFSYQTHLSRDATVCNIADVCDDATHHDTQKIAPVFLHISGEILRDNAKSLLASPPEEQYNYRKMNQWNG